jgi:DNA helicase-2/ATP-dependent DNA helicase PcrA
VYKGKNTNWGKLAGSQKKSANIGPGAGAAKKPTLRGKTLTPINNTGAGTMSGDFLKPHELHEGKRVVHGRFGLGTVVRMEGEGADAKAIINFDNAGEKRLLLKFAKVSAV